MDTQKLLSYLRQCIQQYNMIQSGDVIAVGLSGGKDSMTMLYGLKKLQAFYPEKFDLVAIYVDLGIDSNAKQVIPVMEQYCASLQVPFHTIQTQIYPIIFKERKEKNPCSLCAKMRKGALNDAIKAAGCNKIAYAHHEDDVVETMMLSLFYEGRLHTFSPVTHLDKTDLTVIRPLIYMRESEVIGFVHKYQIPVVKSPCPADGHTRREYVKELLGKLNRENPGVKDRIFTAIQKGNMEGWTDYFGSH